MFISDRIKMVEVRSAYRVLVRKPEGRRPLRRLSHILEVNIKMDLKEIGWEDVDWIYLAQDRDQWQTCEYEPSGSIKCC
jgi:hypothetical protein